MALTLAEAAKLSNDVLQQGIHETVVKESQTLQMLPFMEIVGNALTYNRENSAATAAFYTVGDEWSESTPTFTQLTASLKILGGDADIDNYLRQTRSNIQNIEAVVLALKVKALAQAFDDAFINGDTSTDANAFDGIKRSCSLGQTLSMGDNGAALTLDKLDELIDLHKPGKPHALIMSKRSRRKLASLRRASGNILETDRNQFGQMVTYYDGIPIAVNEWVSDAETEGTSNDCSSIYAASFGEDAVCGLTNGWITVERIGSLETKDATRNRVKWYCGLAVFNSLRLARLSGVRV
jgi:HK97 family phage major capsid protein